MKYLKERYLGSRTFVLNIESFNYHYEEKKKYTNHDHFFLISQHERELFNFSRYYAYIPLWDPPPPPPPYFDRILSSMARRFVIPSVVDVYPRVSCNVPRTYVYAYISYVMHVAFLDIRIYIYIYTNIYTRKIPLFETLGHLPITCYGIIGEKMRLGLLHSS